MPSNLSTLKSKLANRQAKLRVVKAAHAKAHAKDARLEKSVVKWKGFVRSAKARVKAATVTKRDLVVRFAQAQVGTVEQPPGSNRGPKITAWQQSFGSWLVGQAWCGVFAGVCLRQAGVPVNSRIAGVALIEDDARSGANGFKAWTTDPKRVRPADLVVLFGRGIHVEVVVKVEGGFVHTVGGNTSSGNVGSQNNGGGVFARVRSLFDVHGFALVDLP